MSLTTNWVPAYVALGSNLDEPERQVETALVRLAAIPRTQMRHQLAPLRESADGTPGPTAIRQCRGGPADPVVSSRVAGELKRIERDMGRTPPPVRWGPRRIDLDLLLTLV